MWFYNQHRNEDTNLKLTHVIEIEFIKFDQTKFYKLNQHFNFQFN